MSRTRPAAGGEPSFSWARRVYAVLLRLYPQPFRLRLGRELESDFHALLREERSRGAIRGRLHVWRVVAQDLAASVPRERLRNRRALRQHRQRREDGVMGSLGFDLRHALRALRRSPMFAIVTVAILALGIAANTATFSLVRHILLEPLPFEEPERLALLVEAIPQADIERFPFSAPDLLDLEEYQRSFERVASYSAKEVELSGDGEPERLVAERVSHDLFEMLGAEPALGRAFTVADDQPGSDVTILSYGFWQRRFGGSPDVLGGTVVLDRRPVTVIGVMPESFVFPLEQMPFQDDPAELFVPVAFTELERRARGSMHNHAVLGRLAPDVTLEQANAELELVGGRIHANYPQFIRERYDLKLHASPLRDEVVGRVERPLVLLLGAMGLVLLVVCANVANLTLSRTAGRSSELALRAAMGAGRVRLAQVVLLESVMLALLAGALAVVLAKLAVGAVVTRLGAALPLGSRIEVDGVALAFTFGVTALAAVVAGLSPLVLHRAARLEAALREGSAKTTGGRGAHRLQRALVVATVALAVVLLVGSGLLVRSFLRLSATDAGFHQERVLTMGVTLPTSAYPEADEVRGFASTLTERLGALPGVERASLGTALPMSFGEIRAMVAEHPRDPGVQRSVVVTWTGGPYFETLGIPLAQGRTFVAGDREDAALVAIVSAELARELWGEGDPVGERIAWGLAANDSTRWMEVVGVVGDVHDGPLGSEPRPHVYVPLEQMHDSEFDSGVAVGSSWARAFFVSLHGPDDPTRLTGAAVEALHAIDPSLPVTDVQTMGQVVARGVASRRLGMAVVSAFGVVALLLAGVGLYGVLAYRVAARRREIGVRVALGADRATVLRSVLGDGLLLVVTGTAIGLVGAAALVRFLASVLYETSIHDPWAFVTAPLVLVAAALVASYLPACARAASIPCERCAWSDRFESKDPVPRPLTFQAAHERSAERSGRVALAGTGARPEIRPCSRQGARGARALARTAPLLRARSWRGLPSCPLRAPAAPKRRVATVT